VYNTKVYTVGDLLLIRVQVYLDEQDDRWLEERAATTGTSKAALIRAGINALREREIPPEDDPLLDLIGHIADDPSGPHDVAEHHDRYLLSDAPSSRSSA